MDATAATLCSALQTQQSGSPIMGQATGKKQLDVNAGVFINADQPFIQVLILLFIFSINFNARKFFTRRPSHPGQ